MSCDRSVASSGSKLDHQDFVKQVFNENTQLRRRVAELEHERDESVTAYQRAVTQLKRTLEAKVATLERAVYDKNEVIRGLKARVVSLQASQGSSVLQRPFNTAKVECLLGQMGKRLKSLGELTRENYSFIREQLDLIDENQIIKEDDFEPSSIQGSL